MLRILLVLDFMFMYLLLNTFINYLKIAYYVF